MKKVNMRIDIIFFFTGLILILAAYKVDTSMFAYEISSVLRNILLYLGRIFIILKVVFTNSKYNIRELTCITIIFLAFILSWLESGYAAVLDIGLLMIAAKDIDFDKIVMTYFIESLIFLVIVVISVKLGIIDNLVTSRQDSMVERNSYGFIYATEFAATIVWIIISYIYIYRNEYKISNIVVCCIGAYITYFKADARMSTIILVSILIFELGLKKFSFLKNKLFTIIIQILAKYSMFICALVSFLLTIFYNSSSNSMNKLNVLFTGRLELQHMGFLDYGFKMFGQRVDMVGMSIDYANSIIKNYFYIDNAYIQMGMRYGIIFILIMSIVFFMTEKNAIKNRDYIYLYLLIILAINGLVEQHIFLIAYNPFLIKIFSESQGDVYS